MGEKLTPAQEAKLWKARATEKPQVSEQLQHYERGPLGKVHVTRRSEYYALSQVTFHLIRKYFDGEIDIENQALYEGEQAKNCMFPPGEFGEKE